MVRIKFLGIEELLCIRYVLGFFFSKYFVVVFWVKWLR